MLLSSRLCRINQEGFASLTLGSSTGWKDFCSVAAVFLTRSRAGESACMSTSQTPNQSSDRYTTILPASHDIYCIKFPLLWISICFKTCEWTRMKSPSHHWGYYEEWMLPSCLFFSLKQSPLKCVENADVTVSNRQ